ncbi:hypothetical protein ACFQ0O_10195 [Saccharopolyspora spinosporotrichia]|uniref:Site-specific recombinase XerD n=1 Tax=Saccharopolyspora erythraea (strain ATCC 11635 / DSM 40517 / JCM 4748 / NBRC 13426 / NCIMB 8594 / NRRL 2338) TaxID=405948 RepID=A4FC49_SACEN|nr:hypothetical protein [Saccharopolyspora erythraea]EQD82347.1 hypothetical protein N599_31165 [Saccharopolyspora erythraea D]QRK93483.1 hypothetical protein JQX30_12130 [Saccharopolyspora erythraea]CAM01624.1 hypothetical protein SACE_2324 [Saccharopolyspora erythraea NRRL 2338]
MCARCCFTVRLHALLDDGTGAVREDLRAFADGLTAMPNPATGEKWIGRPHVQRMLGALATDPGPITHETVTELEAISHWRSVAFLRDLLMRRGCLPQADRHLLAFDRWLRAKLAVIEHVEHRRLIERFTAWHVRRRLHELAEQRPIAPKQVEGAQHQVSHAIDFLAWLHERGQELGDVGQPELDAWFAEGPFYTRRLATAFLKWAMRAKLISPASIPHRRELNPRPLTQQQRLDVLRRLADDDTIHPTARVSAVLMVLYAQPLLRVLRLTVDDIVRTDTEVLLRLGDPPTPVPAPFDAILTDYLDHRRNLTTSNAGANWLFPSINPGQPMTAAGVRKHLRRAGLPALSGRSAALQQLLLDAPPPVIAKVLGFDDTHLTQVAQQLGVNWSQYAAGDHDRLT